MCCRSVHPGADRASCNQNPRADGRSFILPGMKAHCALQPPSGPFCGRTLRNQPVDTDFKALADTAAAARSNSFRQPLHERHDLEERTRPLLLPALLDPGDGFSIPSGPSTNSPPYRNKQCRSALPVAGSSLYFMLQLRFRDEPLHFVINNTPNVTTFSPVSMRLCLGTNLMLTPTTPTTFHAWYVWHNPTIAGASFQQRQSTACPQHPTIPRYGVAMAYSTGGLITLLTQEKRAISAKDLAFDSPKAVFRDLSLVG